MLGNLPSWVTASDTPDEETVNLMLDEENEGLRISHLPLHLQRLAWESLENRFYAEPSTVECNAQELRARSLRQ